MTDDRSLERAARSWIEVGPTRAPDHAVDAALARIPTTPQERDWFPWRLPQMLTPARVAVAAVIGVLVIGGALFTLARPSAIGAPDASAAGQGMRLADAGGATVETRPSGFDVHVPTAGAVKTVPVVFGARLAPVGPACESAIDPAAGSDVASIIAALQARSGWMVGPRTPVALGAARGWWFDLRRPDGLVCPDGGINVPLFVSELDPAMGVHIDPGYASRLFLLDDGHGGTIVIEVNAHRAFGQAELVGAAMPVILGLRFVS
jgi:hypothetical protein